MHKDMRVQKTYVAKYVLAVVRQILKIKLLSELV